MKDKATFSILVTKPPVDSQDAHSAFRFACAVLNAGHKLQGIFFYQAGVLNGNSYQAGLSDDLDLYSHWCELNKQHNVPLLLCVTAANRRGIINATDAKELDANGHNLTAPFDEVGLGELVELMNQSDRVIQF